MNLKKEIWLFISAFGIMFAVFSWLQEANIIASPIFNNGWIKGFFALIIGSLLYKYFREDL